MGIDEFTHNGRMTPLFGPSTANELNNNGIGCETTTFEYAEQAGCEVSNKEPQVAVLFSLGSAQDVQATSPGER